MNHTNLGWLFYKKSFSILATEVVSSSNPSDQSQGEDSEITKRYKEINHEILSSNAGLLPEAAFKAPNSFLLKTTYPGLLVGTGYEHETGENGEFKIGFFFDYATGLPVIPGSSVKGALRSLFPRPFDREVIQKNKLAYLSKVLQQTCRLTGITLKSLKALELEVFEGLVEDKNLSLYKRDLFLDAVVARENNPQQPLLGEDFITPHKEVTQNPIPLMMLKVQPEKAFRFSFDLKDSKVLPELTADCKQQFFKRLILDWGLGAKTNVGYGQFDAVGEDELNQRQQRVQTILDNIRQEEETEKLNKEKEEKKASDHDFLEAFTDITPDVELNKGEEITGGTISRTVGKKYLISFPVDGKTCEVLTIRKKILGESDSLKITEGAKVTVVVTNNYQPTDEKLMCKFKLV